MLLVKYIIFAFISTLFNLVFQYLSFLIYSDFLALYVAMFFGTLSGLVSKYILDKKFIFYFKIKNKKDDVKKFALYSLMGIFTTIIFWSMEIMFDYIFKNESAKYWGAIVGLTIGYIIKYFLDKKYVFINSEEKI